MLEMRLKLKSSLEQISESELKKKNLISAEKNNIHLLRSYSLSGSGCFHALTEQSWLFER